MHIETPPFSVLALAPFSPALDTDTPPVFTVDSLSLDDALAELSPTLDISVDKTLSPDGSVTITLKRMADFRPKNIAKSTPFIKKLHDAKAYISGGGAPTDLTVKFPRVAQLITIPSPSAAQKPEAKTNAIDDILSMVDTGGSENSAPSNTGAGSVENQIDSITSKLLQAIFADDNFRRMEAAWRGADLLARQAPSGTEPSVHLTLVPLPLGDCLPVFDMLETELANTPPDLILVDKQLSNTPRNMEELERIMDFAESMLAPVAIPIGAEFFGISDWSYLSSVRFIPGQLEGAEYGRWKTLAGRSGAGWVVPCVSGVMARPMHRPEPGFSEQGFSETEPLWISAAWGIGALCVMSVATHGRPTRFSDRATIRLEGMPITDGAKPSPLEILLDRERLADFIQAGILPLTGAPGKDQVFVTRSITMDGGPMKFRLFLSQLTGFLIGMAMTRHDEIKDIETDLAEAISLFIQTLGLPAPPDLKVTAHEAQDGMTPLEITLTPEQEILPGGKQFTFGFGW
ncbi:MAG: type VI secretion system contractile sheath large subunit [Pseudodesulfovibrio sp.]